MRKRIFAILCAVSALGLLAGCSGSENNTPVTTVKETAAETESVQPEETQTESASEEASEAEETENTEEPSENEEPAANTLAEYADAALSAGEWPAMMAVDDEMILSDFFLLDKNNPNYKNLLVMQCPMSANMSELIIIEAEDTAAASDDLKERRKKAQDMDAFYPEDVEKAESAIVGTTGSYAYYIMCTDCEKAEEALLMKLEG